MDYLDSKSRLKYTTKNILNAFPEGDLRFRTGVYSKEKSSQLFVNTPGSVMNQVHPVVVIRPKNSNHSAAKAAKKSVLTDNPPRPSTNKNLNSLDVIFILKNHNKVPANHFVIKKEPSHDESIKEHRSKAPLKLNVDIARHISSYLNLNRPETSITKKEIEEMSIYEKNHIYNIIPLLKRMNIKDNRIVYLI